MDTSIAQAWKKLKSRARKEFHLSRDELILAATVFLVAIGSFALGRLSIIIRPTQPVVIRNPVYHASVDTSTTGLTHGAPSVATSSVDAHSAGAVVASKTGTKYHLPWCAGAQKIREENKIWFATRADAEIAGYTPATNCKGL